MQNSEKWKKGTEWLHYSALKKIKQQQQKNLSFEKLLETQNYELVFTLDNWKKNR